jgi:hypothetical protein
MRRLHIIQYALLGFLFFCTMQTASANPLMPPPNNHNEAARLDNAADYPGYIFIWETKEPQSGDFRFLAVDGVKVPMWAVGGITLCAVQKALCDSVGAANGTTDKRNFDWFQFVGDYVGKDPRILQCGLFTPSITRDQMEHFGKWCRMVEDVFRIVNLNDTAFVVKPVRSTYSIRERDAFSVTYSEVRYQQQENRLTFERPRPLLLSFAILPRPVHYFMITGVFLIAYLAVVLYQRRKRQHA